MEALLYCTNDNKILPIKIWIVISITIRREARFILVIEKSGNICQDETVYLIFKIHKNFP